MNRIDKIIDEFLKEADEVITDEAANDWETRVRKLEYEGCTRSDAQAIVDAEDQRKEQTPYPWCHGNPTKQDCIEAGYCRRNPGCGD